MTEGRKFFPRGSHVVQPLSKQSLYSVSNLCKSGQSHAQPSASRHVRLGNNTEHVVPSMKYSMEGNCCRVLSPNSKVFLLGSVDVTYATHN